MKDGEAMKKIDRLAINTIRMLGVDAINNANSGHPGIVLGAAPMAHTLYTRHLRVYPKQAKWVNRDRFVLSAGHGSMLVYAINHLVDFKLNVDDLKKFRQGGKTPGHPEYGHTDGVDTTSGPLGQGLSNAVGMAIAEAHLAAKFNKRRYRIFDHYTYVICSDGDLQEGIAHEAMSLAGHLGLGKLIVLFDSNDIQLDGPTNLASSDSYRRRFEAINWHYQRVNNGNKIGAINNAIKRAKKTNKPSIIEIKTKIGFGSPLEGSEKAHGAPLGDEARTETAKNLKYPYRPFEIDAKVYTQYKNKVYNRGEKEYLKWEKMLLKYKERHRQNYDLLLKYLNDEFEVSLVDLPSYDLGASIPTRQASGETLEILGEKLPQLMGGSADLSSSTKAKGFDDDFTAKNRLGRNIYYGVREHAMAAITNGIVLHGVTKAFAGGFLVFSDYMKPAIRLAAMMNIPSIFVFTHDSIMVGEDGPTHQPVEQLAMLRSIPNLTVLRPADANETISAWKTAIDNEGPTALILTRQSVRNMSNFDRNFNRGAYIISKEMGGLDGILLATGSEVALAIFVQKALEKERIFTRVVSMPSQEIFEKQDQQYKDSVLPKVKTVAIEMASPMSWYKYTNHVYGVETFGQSAPHEKLREIYKFIPEDIIDFYKNIKA